MIEWVYNAVHGPVFWACLVGFWVAKADTRWGGPVGYWLGVKTREFWQSGTFGEVVTWVGLYVVIGGFCLFLSFLMIHAYTL